LAASLLASGVMAPGCAHYTRAELQSRPGLVASVDQLSPPGARLTIPLSVAQVTALAVRNDPDLRAIRAQRGLAQAQLFQAGLLPDPQFNGALLPLVAGVGITTAWNAALGEDVRALVILSERRRISNYGAGQVNAQILWQEWQVHGQASLLTVDLIEGERSLAVFRQTYDLLKSRSDRLQHALSQGDATLMAAAPDLAALQSARAQVDALEQRQLARRHQLNALLDLAPDAALPLAATPDLPPFDAAKVLADLPGLTLRRPDLIALRLGYKAQDARVRTAILSQFPALSLGLAGGSDNSAVRNLGPQISVTLPVFDRNRGAIAIENATRAQLRAEYAARLDTAEGQIRAMLSEMAVQARQLAVVRQDLAGVDRAAQASEQAFRRGAIDEQAYVDLVSARLTKRQEIIALEQALLDQQVAIQSLTGQGLPAIDFGATS
jgi:outer membrane protein TolC